MEHEILSPAQVSQRFPAYRLPADFQTLFEAGAGFLAPEKCIAAHLGQAQKSGAQLVCGAAVQRWTVEPPSGGSSGSGGSGGSGSAEGLVRVETSQGTFQAKKLVLAAGGWMPALVPELKVGGGEVALRWVAFVLVRFKAVVERGSSCNASAQPTHGKHPCFPAFPHSRC